MRSSWHLRTEAEDLEACTTTWYRRFLCDVHNGKVIDIKKSEKREQLAATSLGGANSPTIMPRRCPAGHFTFSSNLVSIRQEMPEMQDMGTKMLHNVGRVVEIIKPTVSCHGACDFVEQMPTYWVACLSWSPALLQRERMTIMFRERLFLHLFFSR